MNRLYAWAESAGTFVSIWTAVDRNLARRWKRTERQKSLSFGHLAAFGRLFGPGRFLREKTSARSISSTARRLGAARAPAAWETIILRVGWLLSPGFANLSFAPLSAFEAANTILAEPFYEPHVVTPSGGPLG